MTTELSLSRLIRFSEYLTVEQWEGITDKWHPTMKFLTILARQRTEREVGAQEVFSRNQEVSGIKIICAVWSLSYEALDKIIATFSKEEIEYFTALSDPIELGERELWNNATSTELPLWLLNEFKESS